MSTCKDSSSSDDDVISEDVLSPSKYHSVSFWNFLVVVIMLAYVVPRLVRIVYNKLYPSLDPCFCSVEFSWGIGEAVVGPHWLLISLSLTDGTPYPLPNFDDHLIIDISSTDTMVSSTMELVDGFFHKFRVSFTSRVAGAYTISVRLKTPRSPIACQGSPQLIRSIADMPSTSELRHVGSSPYIFAFLPGPLDPLRFSTPDLHLGHGVNSVGAVIVTTAKAAFDIQARDCFANPVEADELGKYLSIEAVVVEGSDPGCLMKPELYCSPNPVVTGDDVRYRVSFTLDEPGRYEATLSYYRNTSDDGDRNRKCRSCSDMSSSTICVCTFQVLVISPEKQEAVEANCSGRKLSVYYKAKMKGKDKVWVYLSHKYLCVREYKFGFCPYDLFKLKFLPSASFKLLMSSDLQDAQGQEYQSFMLDNQTSPPLLLVSKDRNLIFATFQLMSQANGGRFISFEEKRRRLYASLRDMHHNGLFRFSNVSFVTVRREELFRDAYQSMNSFSTRDWRCKLHITFQGEQGLDWGGVTREFYTLLCRHLFDNSGLFRRFVEDDSQALVHPTSVARFPDKLKLEYHHFAGRLIGKVIYDAAVYGSTGVVHAHFSRSFLRTLAGMRVSYGCFESDDPVFFTSKVKYLLSASADEISNLGLKFSDEVYDNDGHLLREDELESGGRDKSVTGENRCDYLHRLAQYRLVTSVKAETETFIRGLCELVPKDMLAMFTENELELLMCGISIINISDLRANVKITGATGIVSTWNWNKQIEWFFVLLENFTQEERARVLQFTTGSSQLPPGGFIELDPPFTICLDPAADSGRLPTAHTCFNSLHMPQFSSYEQLENAMTICINEGTEGFGLT